MSLEKIDISAEVSMYYHTEKVYDYLTSLGLKNFTHLEGHEKDGEKIPLSVIANFQMPDTEKIMSGGKALAPFDNAFFSPYDPMITPVLEKYGIKGDMLVFGMGSFGSFAYDGDVVYHEFGHATIHATAHLTLGAYPDMYGMSNEPGALHEGIADTISNAITADPCVGEYASNAFREVYLAQATNDAERAQVDANFDKDGEFFCMRHGVNETIVNEDFIGEVHHDGKPMVAANWSIYKLAIDKKLGATDQESVDLFVKLILKALISMPDSQGDYKMWAETFMDEVKNDDKFSPYESEIAKIIADRDFANDVRARNLEGGIPQIHSGAADSQSAGQEGSATMQIEDDGNQIYVSPAYIQFYYTMPAEMTALTISAVVQAGGGTGISMGGNEADPDYKLYVRAEEPIIYELNDDDAIVVNKDMVIDPNGSNGMFSWKVYGLEAGKKYYFQFVNYAATAGIVANINAKASSETEPVCVAEGESGSVSPDSAECCEGLEQIGCDTPENDGTCPSGCEGAFICTKCGNGECGPGENYCNCPDDCEDTTTDADSLLF